MARQEQGKMNPNVLFVTVGDTTLQVLKSPNPFFYWVDPRSKDKGVAELVGKDPWRVRWVNVDVFDQKLGRAMKSADIFVASTQKPEKVELEFEEEGQTGLLEFTEREKQSILSKEPILRLTKREREQEQTTAAGGRESFRIEISPELLVKERELEEKEKRMYELRRRLQNQETMESEYEDLRREIDILREQYNVLSKWIDERRSQLREKKRREAEEYLERVRQQLEKELENESDEELKRARRLRKETSEKLNELVEISRVQEPETRLQRYISELNKLKKDVTKLRELREKLEKLREIEEIANTRLFGTDRKRTLVEFKVYFPPDLVEFMDSWKSVKNESGEIIDPFRTELTRPSQVALLRYYLCGYEKARGVHIPGYVETVLKLDNEYCKITIKE